MKAYTRSYILGGLLITAAFVTLFADIKWMPLRTKTGSWVLFLGGAILVTVGWREQNEAQKKKKD